jgi:outer membrane lipoprotein carrier protein
MKQKLLLLLFATASFANITNIQSFEADFVQKIVDDKNKTIFYYGHIKAQRPQFALWEYKKPIIKSVYILQNEAVIVEPELEQAIVKKIGSNFDFFQLMKNAKKIAKNSYRAKFNNTNFIIKLDANKITSISYKDEFENNVTIDFSHQVENKKIDKKAFEPHIPDDYDIIRN